MSAGKVAKTGVLAGVLAKVLFLRFFLASPSATFVLSFFGRSPLHERKGIPLPTSEPIFGKGMRQSTFQ